MASTVSPAPSPRPRTPTLRHLLELIRFSHTLFALPFALLAAAMAWSADLRARPPVGFRPLDLLGILVCMVFARSAAMAFNRLADRRLDALNLRTQMRHLPSGVLGTTAVVFFTVFCALGFVAGTLLFLPHNPLPLWCSPAVLAFLFGYSFAKRFTVLSHFWLGAALMLAPLAAWVAIRGGRELGAIGVGGGGNVLGGGVRRNLCLPGLRVRRKKAAFQPAGPLRRSPARCDWPARQPSGSRGAVAVAAAGVRWLWLRFI